MVMAQRALGSRGPHSWLFYIMANVGPSDSYRRLAVTLVQGNAASPIKGCNLVRTCLRIMTILSDVANQLAVRGELRLAKEFYQRGSNLPRAELPEPNPWPGLSDLEGDSYERAWDRGLREFPFLSTCLLLGTGYDPSTGVSYDVRTEPLGTVYRDDSLEYGMVALDISDLDSIRYGIVGFTVSFMAEVNLRDDGDYDPVEDSPPEDDPVPTLEEDRPRVPLSAREYMSKFYHHGHDDVVQMLEQKLLIDNRVLDCRY